MSKLLNLTKKVTNIFLILSLFSCAERRTDFEIDKGTHLSKGKFREALLKNKKNIDSVAQDTKANTPIPNISKLIITPPAPVIGGEKIISFSVTDQVSLKDVLIELGRVSKIDVDVDPSISGGIILNAKNRPFKEVIDRIAALGNLRYSYQNGVLHFERDTPFSKNYFVDYLLESSLWADVEKNITALLTGSSSAGDDMLKSSFSSGKSTGIIAIFATEKQHKEVEKYLKDVEKKASSQVLIEAKVMEVTLSEEYQHGINWSFLNGTTQFNSTNGASIPDPGKSPSTPFYLSSGKWFNANFGATITALEQFGTVRAISSPRVHAINNQKAILNFTDKLVYFKIESNQATTNTAVATTTSTLTSTKMEESVGVQLEITPSINLKTNEISMTIKPKLSINTSSVSDPASPKDLTDAEGKKVINKIPVIQTREINTTAKIKSGNVVVIGGLMKDNTTGNDNGIPFLKSIPILGLLFKNISKSSAITETVIFVKATIINNNNPLNKEDGEFQENFDSSRRNFLNK